MDTMEEKVLFDGDNKQKRFYLKDTMRTFNNKGESIFVETSDWREFYNLYFLRMLKQHGLISSVPHLLM